MQRARKPRRPPDSAPAEPLFPPRQAVVVHFQVDSDASDARCAGRVEHVLSGRSARFRSAADLLTAMQRLLRENGGTDHTTAAGPPTPPAEPGRRSFPRGRTEARTSR